MKKDFEELTDEELISRYREGDQDALEYLMVKYKNLVRSKAKSMYILGGDNEDLIQEGMLGLFKAVRDYDFGRDAGFFTFAQLCVTRQIYTAVEASGRKKHMPLNEAISFYSKVTGDDKEAENGMELANTLKSESNNPESQVIMQENIENIEDIIQSQLSTMERQVMELYITEMPTSEISGILGIDEKSADNALQRAKSKIRKAMGEK